MQIRVAKSDLEASLQTATLALSSAGSDLSTHYLFRVKDSGKVEVLTYSQRVGATVPLFKCDTDGAPGDAMTVEGWRLETWLKGVGDVAITLETLPDQGVVRVSSPRSTVKMKSLDPTKFPFWDKTFADSKLVCSIPAHRLLSALSYARKFISDRDTSNPEITQLEFMSGGLWATDKRAMTMIEVGGMEKSNLRIHNKDLQSAIRFLTQAGTDTVQCREHDRSAFLVRDDGAVLGISRPLVAFPTLRIDKDSPSTSEWEIKAADLVSGIQCLSASAEKGNTKLRFAYDPAEDKVNLSVESSAGGRDEYPVSCLASANPEGITADGFDLDYHYLTETLSHFGSETLRLGINIAPQGKGGYVRLRHTVLHNPKDLDGPADTYLTVVVWRL